MTIGGLIQRERTIQGYSLQELADISGVSKTYIHQIERGDRKGTGAIHKLLPALLLPPDYGYYLIGRWPPDIVAMQIEPGLIQRMTSLLREHYVQQEDASVHGTEDEGTGGDNHRPLQGTRRG